MSIVAVLLPVFLLVLLAFALLAATATTRVRAITGGKVKVRDIALTNEGWTPDIRKWGNAYGNQFELPVLFYLAVVLAILTRKADLVSVVLEWVFVATRVAHAFVFVTSNHVPRRFQFFAAGVLTLAILWVWLALRILMMP